MSTGMTVLQEVMLIREVLVITGIHVNIDSFVQKFKAVLIRQRMATRTKRAGTERKRHIAASLSHIREGYSFANILIPNKVVHICFIEFGAAIGDMASCYPV